MRTSTITRCPDPSRLLKDFRRLSKKVQMQGGEERGGRRIRLYVAPTSDEANAARWAFFISLLGPVSDSFGTSFSEQDE